MSSRRRSARKKPDGNALGIDELTNISLQDVIDAIFKVNDPKGASAQAIRHQLEIDDDQSKERLKTVLLEGLDSRRLHRPPGSKAARGLVGRFLVVKEATDDVHANGAAIEEVGQSTQRKRRQRRKKSTAKTSDQLPVSPDVKTFHQEKKEEAELGASRQNSERKKRQRRRKSTAKTPDELPASPDVPVHQEEKEGAELGASRQRRRRQRRRKSTAKTPDKLPVSPNGHVNHDRGRERIQAGGQDKENAEEKDGSEQNNPHDMHGDTSGHATTLEGEAPGPVNITFDCELADPAAYLHKVREERARLAARCQDAERYQRWNLPADILEHVRTAIGRSKLITTNKKSPMAILERQCLDAMAPGGDNPHRPTLNDLGAYWDLVQIQIQHIDDQFDKLDVAVKRQSMR